MPFAFATTPQTEVLVQVALVQAQAEAGAQIQAATVAKTQTSHISSNSNTDASISKSIASRLTHSKSPLILIVGDSLSAAYGIEPAEGWVSLLKNRLKEKGYPYQVINSSISGDTTSNGKTRIPKLIEEYKPSILILGLGSNDGLRGLSTVAMKQNLTAMVVEAKQNHAKVLLVGFLIPLNYGEEYRKKFEQVYREVVKEQKLPNVPFLLEKVAQDPNLMQSDGLHPNKKAQPIILENVLLHLEPMLQKPV